MGLVLAPEEGETTQDEEGNIVEPTPVVPEFSSFEEFLDIAAEDEVDAMEVIQGLVDAWKADTRPALNAIPEDRGNLKSAGGDRPERGERPNRDNDSTDFDTLYFGVGREDDISAGQLNGMIYNECGVSSGGIGKIKIFGRHTLVDIKKDEVQSVLDANLTVGNRQVPVRPDRGFGGGKEDKGRRGGDRRERRGGGGGGRDRDRDRRGGGSGGGGRSFRDRKGGGGGERRKRRG